MLRFALLCLVLSILSPCLAHADFTSACDAYEEGKFAEAKQEFTVLLEEGISPELAFNLGSTEAKLGNAPAAILWFNRALLLRPRHRESLQNLRQLKQKEGVFAFDDTAWDDFARGLKPATWRVACLGGLWALGLGSAVLMLLRPSRIWPWITGISLAFVLTIATGLGWMIRCRQTPAQELSVVVSGDSLSLQNAPAETADPLIGINGGSLVHPLETRGKWTYVELPGEYGTRGWLKSSVLEKLWPYAPGLIE
jgi:hypothetical protein